MNITWYGTASIKLDDGKTSLLFDPFIRPNKKLVKISAEDFCGADAILATHAHFDHIVNIPDIVKLDKNVPIYGTQTTLDNLRKFDVPYKRMNLIEPGDRFSIGDFTITVYQGKHVKYDSKYVAEVFPKCFVFFPKVFYYEYFNMRMPENGETVVYEVENNGKRVVLMGSYGTVDDIVYPTQPDVFILPLGGNGHLQELTAPFINKISPKKIVVDHHDASFPPLTKRIDAEGFGANLAVTHPEIEYVIPEEFAPVTV